MTAETIYPSSTMLASASFDPDTGELTVEMQNGRTYTTPNITPEQWADLKQAPSPGSWYRANIMRRP